MVVFCPLAAVTRLGESWTGWWFFCSFVAVTWFGQSWIVGVGATFLELVSSNKLPDRETTLLAYMLIVINTPMFLGAKDVMGAVTGFDGQVYELSTHFLIRTIVQSKALSARLHSGEKRSRPMLM